jgi:hypothetical protein
MEERIWMREGCVPKWMNILWMKENVHPIG